MDEAGWIERWGKPPEDDHISWARPPDWLPDSGIPDPQQVARDGAYLAQALYSRATSASYRIFRTAANYPRLRSRLPHTELSPDEYLRTEPEEFRSEYSRSRSRAQITYGEEIIKAATLTGSEAGLLRSELYLMTRQIKPGKRVAHTIVPPTAITSFTPIEIQRIEDLPDPEISNPPTHLPRWKEGAAVLVGTSQYAYLNDVPSIANNLAALNEVLARGLGILEKNIYRVENPESAAAVHDAIEEARLAIDPVSGGLIVYYAGHGWMDPFGRLLLGLVGSDQRKSWSALPFATIREQLADSQVAARIVVLDACYSGAALDLLSGGVQGSLAVEGSYVMTSSDNANTSLAPADGEYTSFTGEIIKALSEGIPNAGETIEIDDLFRHVRGVFEQRGWPLPDRQIRTNGGKLPLMTNPWGRT
ncbi:caspase domain-containing protein [Streptomyces sp. NPDC087420]|uniref:caspase family protein n=1 Tax=Streptomyces sp. NPDC087420 TaxID=3365785 RepID=UPI0038370815